MSGVRRRLALIDTVAIERYVVGYKLFGYTEAGVKQVMDYFMIHNFDKNAVREMMKEINNRRGGVRMPGRPQSAFLQAVVAAGEEEEEMEGGEAAAAAPEPPPVAFPEKPIIPELRFLDIELYHRMNENFVVEFHIRSGVDPESDASFVSATAIQWAIETIKTCIPGIAEVNLGARQGHRGYRFLVSGEKEVGLLEYVDVYQQRLQAIETTRVLGMKPTTKCVVQKQLVKQRECSLNVTRVMYSLFLLVINVTIYVHSYVVKLRMRPTDQKNTTS